MSIDEENPVGLRSATPWGWGLCWLLFACTILNYMDRQAVAVVDLQIKDEFKIDNEGFGWILASFGLTYALFQVPAGFLVDRWDVRKVYSVAVVWWSLAAITVAWSPTLGALMACRGLLGLGEAFNWPCALKVTAMVLPAKDRSLGNGIFNSGAAVGAVITPLVAAPLTYYLGWRWAFALIGAAGLVWVAVWNWAVWGRASDLFEGHVVKRPVATKVPNTTKWAFAVVALLAIVGGTIGFFHESTTVIPAPERTGTLTWNKEAGATIKKGETIGTLRTGSDVYHPIVTSVSGTLEKWIAAQGQTVPTGEPMLALRFRPLGLSAIWLAIAFSMASMLIFPLVIPKDQLGNGWMADLGHIVRLRRFWVMAVVSITSNVSWHFLVNWLPSYLKTDLGMSFAKGSFWSAVPFLAADVGNLAGGWASRRLTGQGMSTFKARVIVLCICVLFISSGASVGFLTNKNMIIGIIAVMALGTAAFMVNMIAFAQDISSRHTGLIVGVLGGIGNLFAGGFSPIAGRIKDTTGNFSAVFLVVGLIPFIGLATLILAWGKERNEAKSYGEASLLDV